MYADNEEIVSCEVFRNRLKLLSCPETIHQDVDKSTWVFSGIGEGHGEGISVAKARAQAGHSAPAILTDAYK
jgi:peptidoglycan hydrolase-like amidase